MFIYVESTHNKMYKSHRWQKRMNLLTFFDAAYFFNFVKIKVTLL